jgi:hypothetical protein
VNQNLVNLIHDRVGFFDTQHFRQGGKALHIAEHHCDLLAFAFDSIFLSKNFFGDALGKVFLNLGNFFVKGKFLGGLFGK